MCIRDRDICGYELATNQQNFTEKHSLLSENIAKNFRGLLFFDSHCRYIRGVQDWHLIVQDIMCQHLHCPLCLQVTMATAAAASVTTRSQDYLIKWQEGGEGSKLSSGKQVLGHSLYLHNFLKEDIRAFI